MNIPTAVHESNAVPGLAVRKLVPYVDRIFTNFAVSAELLGKSGKVMQVGCPMLGEFGNITREEGRMALGIKEECKHYLLSFGGSLGAAAMNDMALELMRNYVSSHPDIKYTHATGGDHYESVYERFKAMGLEKFENIELCRYIYDMPQRMAAADIVISRAGAITISELARQGKAAILIPSPNVTDDQQTKNAKALADIGGACMIREPELTGERICSAVASLLEDEERRNEMARSILGFAPLDSNKLIFDELMRLVETKR
jgi:UDP-N-acetylglucosamine--N-acetylmuramyl-(pentapeptide) pyrophosphoryl-undecaprenol N-acetylglucosamine transferase